MNDTMAPRVSPMVLKIETRRLAAAMLVAASALTSCSLLPPSLRGEEDKAAHAAPGGTSAPAQDQPGPAAPPAAQAPRPSQADTSATADTKLFKGSGVFINPK